MRVLMLGWEFPPHITGGLGTACFGLTQGLRSQGVETLFVVPRSHGDEDKRFARIVGCNEVMVEAPAGASPAGDAPAGEGGPGWATRLEPGDAARLTDSLRILAIDSLLSPYLSPAAYEQRWRDAQRHATARSSAAHSLDSAWQALCAAVGGELAGTGQLLDQALRREGHLQFTGRYGPDLMTEVARYAIAVAGVARRESFDVVHAHDWMTYPAGMVAAAVSRCPLVVHVHACEFDRSGENVNERIQGIERLGLFAARLVVCVSHYTAGILRTRYRVPHGKLRVVHNAVQQAEAGLVVRREKPIPAPVVLFLGRVTFQKGPDYFLEAAARVVRVRPDVKFVMAGHGDMWTSMVERAARLGLARNVHFTGFLHGPDVERIYGMADVYVMPSVSEPFGISPLEAMAHDVPVIVSRQSGVSELLRNALKVDFWDVEDLANKILGLLEREALHRQLREDGRDEVRHIRWEQSGRALRGVYEEAIGQGRRAQGGTA